IESFTNATALGVDIYGPMPTDAEFVDGHWEAEPGTKAHAWFRAQIDIDWDSMPEKRQGSGLAQIEMTMLAWGNINYNTEYVTRDNMFSLDIAGRTIRSNERLEIYSRVGGNACGQFL
ncbi:hypothetical protein B0I35DRAFT_325131, partial [Stachybotrys elegans]